MKINQAGLDLIKRFEGLRLDAYQCAAGVWTIGYGHASDVKKGDRITAHQAEAILDCDLDRFERCVDALGVALTPNQFSACVSLAFNIGVKAFTASTLAKKLKAGDTQGAAGEFMKWKLAAGRVLPGLVKRRDAEKKLFQTP